MGTGGVVLLGLVPACAVPTLGTDLWPEGPPRVLAVLVPSEGTGAEVATWCSEAPGARAPETSCPSPGPVLDAPPLAWRVRVVLDELLDPVSAASGAFLLACDGDPIETGAFYDPAGNHLTRPPGPSLVVAPASFVATSSACELRLTAAVVDPDGEEVPEEERGPWTLSVAPLSLAAVDPADGAEAVAPSIEPLLRFNAPVDAASLDGRVVLESDEGEVATTAAVPEDDPTAVVVWPDAPLAEETAHTLTVRAGVLDVAGAALGSDWTTTFSTGRGE